MRITRRCRIREKGWDRFHITNKRIIVTSRLIPVAKSSLEWKDVVSVEETEKGLRIEGMWKGKKLVMEMSTKKLGDDVVLQIIQLAKSHGGQ